MASPTHPLGAPNIMEKYFNTLPANDISRRYYAGEKYESTFFNRIGLFFSVNSTLKELTNFYPYSPVVVQSQRMYNEMMSKALQMGVAISAVSILSLYSLAKKGYVMPVLSQFGRIFQTHRLFRQYIYALILPTALLVGSNQYTYLNHCEHFWATHARRLNQKLLKDPEDTRYPTNMLAFNEVRLFEVQQLKSEEIEKRMDNQVQVFNAPDYKQPTYQTWKVQYKKDYNRFKQHYLYSLQQEIPYNRNVYEFEGEMITPHEADFRKIGDYVRTILKRGKKAEEVTEKKVKIFVEKILNVILNENIKKEYLEHPEIIEHRKTKLEEEREKRFELVSEMSVEDFQEEYETNYKLEKLPINTNTFFNVNKYVTESLKLLRNGLIVEIQQTGDKDVEDVNEMLGFQDVEDLNEMLGFQDVEDLNEMLGFQDVEDLNEMLGFQDVEDLNEMLGFQDVEDLNEMLGFQDVEDLNEMLGFQDVEDLNEMLGFQDVEDVNEMLGFQSDENEGNGDEVSNIDGKYLLLLNEYLNIKRKQSKAKTNSISGNEDSQ